jgi:hypothetical protein
MLDISGFRLLPGDEHPHTPDGSPNFNESVYTNAFDTASGAGGWMRLGNRAGEGHAELSVCLYLPGGRVACQFQRPRIEGNERFDAGGLSVQVRAPLSAIDMAYEGEVMLLENADALRDPAACFKTAPRVPASVLWRHAGVVAPHGGEPTSPGVPTMYGRDFSLGHFNQHTRVTGHIRIGDEEFVVNGLGWRDHSWGPRHWSHIYWYRLFLAHFPDGRALMLLKRATPAGEVVRAGVLMVDNAYEDITDLDIFTEWTVQQDPARMRMTARTARRTAIIDAEVLSLAPLRNRRQIDGVTVVTRIAEGATRYSWGGVLGFGMAEYIERIEDGRLVGFPL